MTRTELVGSFRVFARQDDKGTRGALLLRARGGVQTGLEFHWKANTERIKKQRATPIFVCIGNPPYNAWQVNENDNNRNRKYPEVDDRVRETYGNDSARRTATHFRIPTLKRFAGLPIA